MKRNEDLSRLRKKPRMHFESCNTIVSALVKKPVGKPACGNIVIIFYRTSDNCSLYLGAIDAKFVNILNTIQQLERKNQFFFFVKQIIYRE